MLPASKYPPALFPSVDVLRENPTKQKQKLASLMTRIYTVSSRLDAADGQNTFLGPELQEVYQACGNLQRGGAVDGNLLQSFQVTREGIQALQVALAVIDHNLPGFETQIHQPQRQEARGSP